MTPEFYAWSLSKVGIEKVYCPHPQRSKQISDSAKHTFIHFGRGMALPVARKASQSNDAKTGDVHS